jgi:hypothetical protein
LIDRPSQLLIPAPGIDGELPAAVVLDRIDRLRGRSLADLDGEVFKATWHPSEASGLLAVAADGVRGRVEVRDAGCQIHLTDATPAVYALDANDVNAVGLASALAETTGLAEAVTAGLTGISELEYERRKAQRLRDIASKPPTIRDLPQVDAHAAEAATRGADFVSVRRLAELIGVRSAPHSPCSAAYSRRAAPSATTRRSTARDGDTSTWHQVSTRRPRHGAPPPGDRLGKPSVSPAWCIRRTTGSGGGALGPSFVGV